MTQESMCRAKSWLIGVPGKCCAWIRSSAMPETTVSIQLTLPHMHTRLLP